MGFSICVFMFKVFEALDFPLLVWCLGLGLAHAFGRLPPRPVTRVPIPSRPVMRIPSCPIMRIQSRPVMRIPSFPVMARYTPDYYSRPN